MNELLKEAPTVALRCIDIDRATVDALTTKSGHADHNKVAADADTGSHVALLLLRRADEPFCERPVAHTSGESQIVPTRICTPVNF